jgi:hypothetical protein
MAGVLQQAERRSCSAAYLESLLSLATLVASRHNQHGASPSDGYRQIPADEAGLVPDGRKLVLDKGLGTKNRLEIIFLHTVALWIAKTACEAYRCVAVSVRTHFTFVACRY